MIRSPGPAGLVVRIWMTVLVLLLAACSPAPTASVSAAADAHLTVTGSGRVACYPSLVCVASLVLVPNPTGDSSGGSWAVLPDQQFTFAPIQTPILDVWGVGALSPGLSSIAAGRYRLAGVSTSIDDRVTPVPTAGPTQVFPVCSTDLTVVPNTSVHIALDFKPFAQCTITTTVGAESAAPSPRTLGVVPPESMSISVSNGTTTQVEVWVNGSDRATLGAGACVGCQGDDGIPASILYDLPWRVEVRTPAGRGLVGLEIRAGDVVYTNSGSKGDGSRVDLSCGRIDIWSGPPIDGPSPGPGTPGDCRP